MLCARWTSNIFNLRNQRNIVPPSPLGLNCSQKRLLLCSPRETLQENTGIVQRSTLRLRNQNTPGVPRKGTMNIPLEEHTTCSIAETFDQFWHRGRPEPRHSSFFYHIDPAPQKQAREMRRSAKTVHCEHKSTTCMSSRVRQRRFSSHVSAVVAVVSAVSSDPPDCHNVSHPGSC